MDTLDDSENNAKISDSAYSNSCSNSQSRRSHSSKSTHSGSHSSGSSGYGGNPGGSSGCGTSTGKPPEKRLKEKEVKKKKTKVMSSKSKSKSTDTQPPKKCVPPEPVKEFKVPKEERINVALRSSQSGSQADTGVESNMEISTMDRTTQDELGSENTQLVKCMNVASSRSSSANISDNFSCVISMHDGIIMFTSTSITTVLGYPREMLAGRSFLDFIHEKDRNVFASQITSGLAVPKDANGMRPKAITQVNTNSSVVCRIRRYRGLATGFLVKNKSTTYIPFQLKFSFKKVNDMGERFTFLVIQATPYYSAYKTPYEIIPKAVPFIIRHAANGNMEFVDPDSVPYLGYLPQDLIDKNALQLYHPHDLDYLQQVYETTVREGSFPRCSPYRMMAQNGDYIKLESEWSSFINPWSKKLEFVIGIHHVIEGPRNPDIFFPPNPSTMFKLNEDDKAKTQCMRENIVRIMNEVLTKPAEMAKQQMAKRCQDIAELMESLIEDTPKPDDDLRIDLHDLDTSYYERDSVMLGGISPHHDFNDSKSSTDTPLSYNQLNYNDNLQRYFDSHESYAFEDTILKGDNIFGITERVKDIGDHPATYARSSRSSDEGGSRHYKNILFPGHFSLFSQDYIPMRLTESMLRKHNAEMEKELVRMHRETRVCSRSEREKAVIENRQKKKEHLARCNAAFQPTSAGGNPLHAEQPQGLKRSSRTPESEPGAHKHQCTSPRVHRRWQTSGPATCHTPTAVTTTTVADSWPSSSVDNMNKFLLGMTVPQPVPILTPVNTMPGIVPMYYTTAINRPMTTDSRTYQRYPYPPYQPTPVPCMMYGQTMYGQPVMYAPYNPQLSYDMHQNFVNQGQTFASSINPLLVTRRNFDEGHMSGIHPKPKPQPQPQTPNMARNWRARRKSELQSRFMKQPDSGSSSSAENSNGVDGECRPKVVERDACVYSETARSSKSTEAIPDTSRRGKSKLSHCNNEEKTDGESSYYSFYSSFFKTESGSAEDSDNKKSDKECTKPKPWRRLSQNEDWEGTKKPAVTTPKRSSAPPWMDQVSLTSELVYRYQVVNKNLEEVLSSDKEKMKQMEQSPLVNEQLAQLYLDLQLEGVAARLTLEEGITSSSSSDEDNAAKIKKSKSAAHKKKQEYSKLVMIYEEDAPFPPPDDGPVAPSLLYD